MKNVPLIMISALIMLPIFGCGKRTVKEYVTTTVTSSPVSNTKMYCSVYDLTGLGFSVLPDFSTLSKSGNVTIRQLDAASSSTSVPYTFLVGTAYESMTQYVGLQCFMTLNVTVAGTYTLALNSDDGSRLYVNGVLRVNNDNLHGMTKVSSNVSLNPGVYNLKLEYFNNAGPKGIQFTITPPGMFEKFVNEENLQ